MRRLTPRKALSASIATRGRDADVARGGDGRERVGAVVVAHQRPGDAPQKLAPPAHVEAFVRPELGHPAVGHTEPLEPRPAAAPEDARERGVRAVRHDQARARQRAHEVMKLRLDRRQVGKDVDVVELEVGQDRGARAVVHELRALVEERGVVLVGLDHEEVRAGPRRALEIARDAADQEPGRRPACSRIQASIAVVVVLPCVPATASTCRPASTCSASHCGPEVNGAPRSRISSMSGLPRVTTLPTTHRSGLSAIWSAAKPSRSSMPGGGELRAHGRIDVRVASR